MLTTRTEFSKFSELHAMDTEKTGFPLQIRGNPTEGVFCKQNYL